MPEYTEGERELAARLCTAYVSYQMGLKSMDHTRTAYIDAPVGEGIGERWLSLARQVLHNF